MRTAMLSVVIGLTFLFAGCAANNDAAVSRDANGCCKAKASCPKAAGTCPMAKEGCPKAQGACPKAQGACPKAQGTCPKDPANCPKAKAGCCAAKGAADKPCCAKCKCSCACCGGKVLRHVVLFKFKDGTTPEQVATIVDAFKALPGKIPGIKGFEWGTNVSPEKHSEGLTHAFTLTFTSEADRDAYLPDPAHKEFGKILGPHLEKVVVVDYWAQK